MANDDSWARQIEKVPSWIVILAAVVGAPAGIGSAFWSSKQENNLYELQSQVQVLNEKVDSLRQNNSQIWNEMAKRVRIEERLEMLGNITNRFERLQREIERSETRLNAIADRVYSGNPYEDNVPRKGEELR